MATRQPTSDQQLSGTGPTPPPSRAGAAIGASVVLALLVGGIFVAVRVLGGDDASPGAGADPSPSVSASSSESPSAEPSSEPTDADTSDSGVLDEQWQRDAVKATNAGLAAMVPSVLPEGWAVVSGEFDRAGPTWSMALTSPTGPVVLEQAESGPRALVEQHVGPDASPAGRLDLSDFGTGEWLVWRSASSVGITVQLDSSSVLLVGSDEAALEALAQTLITAEDAPVGGMDG